MICRDDRYSGTGLVEALRMLLLLDEKSGKDER